MAFDLTLKDFLQEVVDSKSSDLHISKGSPAMLRIDGELQPTKQAPDHMLDPEDSKRICYENLNEKMIKEFETNKELDFSFSFEGKARFGGNLSY